jgi:hypothetical protein
VAVSVDTSRTPTDSSHTVIASVHPPIVAGVTLDSTGWQVVLLFYYVNIGRFLMLLLGVASATLPHFVNSVATSAITRNKREQRILCTYMEQGKGEKRILGEEDKKYLESAQMRLESSKWQFFMKIYTGEMVPLKRLNRSCDLLKPARNE